MGGLVSKAIFPVPKSSYDESDFKGVDRLFFIQTPNHKKIKQLYKMPALYLPYLDEEDNTSPYLLIYFHANAEDIGLAYDSLLFDLRTNLQISILAPEYPGYGLYSEGKPSARQLESDAEQIYQYAVSDLKYPEDKIILFGRSIGGGPLSHVAARFKPRAAIYFMCFASLRKVAENLTSKVLAKVVPDEFKNVNIIKYIHCPIMIIHGRRDTLVPFSQAEDMWKSVQKIAPRSYIQHHHHFSNDMTHSSFYLDQDLVDPLEEFFKMNKMEIMNSNTAVEFMNMPLFQVLYKDLQEEYNQEDSKQQENLKKTDEDDYEENEDEQFQQIQQNKKKQEKAQKEKKKQQENEKKNKKKLDNPEYKNEYKTYQEEDSEKDEDQLYIKKQQFIIQKQREMMERQNQEQQQQQQKQQYQQQQYQGQEFSSDEEEFQKNRKSIIHQQTTKKSFHATAKDLEQMEQYEYLFHNKSSIDTSKNNEFTQYTNNNISQSEIVQNNSLKLSDSNKQKKDNKSKKVVQQKQEENDDIDQLNQWYIQNFDEKYFDDKSSDEEDQNDKKKQKKYQKERNYTR